MEYRYKIENVKDEEKLLNTVRSIKGVDSAEMLSGELICELSDCADEYEIMTAVFNECESQGGKLIFEESPQYEDQPSEEVETGDNEVIDGVSVEEKKEIPDFEYEVDRIVSNKKRIKTETLTRFIELSVSVLLFVISLFIKQDESATLSFKNVLTILSFAVAAYESLYNAITDVIKKRWTSENVYMSLAYIAGALIGLIGEITVAAIVFAIGKEIETYRNEINKLKIDDNYYTGSFSVACKDQGSKPVSELIAGDEITLSECDVVPCDSVLSTDAVFDCFKTERIVEKTARAGEIVYAGSVLLSENAEMTAIKTNAESMLSVRKSEFDKKLSQYGVVPAFLKYLTPVLFIIAAVLTIVLSAVSKDGFAQSIADNGRIGVFIAFCGNIFYLVTNVLEIKKSAVVAADGASVEFADKNAFNDLGSANSFVFDAAVLTEKGEVKEDVSGALTELLNCGAKNITTDFSGSDLPIAVKKKINFADKTFKGEKKIKVGPCKDISLSGDGRINVCNGELSFVPLAFKIAGKAKKLTAFSAAVSVAAFCAAAALSVIFGFNVYFALPVLSASVIVNIFSVLTQKERI